METWTADQVLKLADDLERLPVVSLVRQASVECLRDLAVLLDTPAVTRAQTEQRVMDLGYRLTNPTSEINQILDALFPAPTPR